MFKALGGSEHREIPNLRAWMSSRYPVYNFLGESLDLFTAAA